MLEIVPVERTINCTSTSPSCRPHVVLPLITTISKISSSFYSPMHTIHRIFLSTGAFCTMPFSSHGEKWLSLQQSDQFLIFKPPLSDLPNDKFGGDTGVTLSLRDDQSKRVSSYHGSPAQYELFVQTFLILCMS